MKFPAGLKNPREIALLTLEEIDAEVRRVRYEEALLRAKRAGGELKQTHLLTLHRRGIARLLTARRLLESSVA